MAWILNQLVRLMSALPRAGALRVGIALSWIYGYVIRYHRRDAFDALRRSFPEKSEGEIRGIVNSMYRNLGRNVAEMLRIIGGKAEEMESRFTWEGEEIVRDALKKGRGALILMAHVGNWEMLGLLTARRGLPVNAIVKTVRNPGINAFLERVRNEFGLKTLPARNSYRPCLKALKHNELVAFVIDQNRPPSAGIFVNFFGRPACTTPALAYLSAQSGAPVIPVFMTRLDSDRHVLRILTPIDPPKDREEETIRQATQEYTKAVEDAVRLHPDQWIWIHRRWRTKPAAAASPAIN